METLENESSSMLYRVGLYCFRVQMLARATKSIVLLANPMEDAILL